MRGDPSNWLLDESDPSVRYFFLTDILERPLDQPTGREARQAIRSSPAVQSILATQNPDGWWETPDDLYRPKHRATAWQLILLAELGATGQDFRVAEAADFVLARGTRPDGNIHLSAPLLRSLLRFGYSDDPRVQNALEALIARARARDDPDGDEPCPWAGLKTLWVLSEVPPDRRGPEAQAIIARDAERFLSQDFAALPDERVLLIFPPFTQADLLFGLRMMVALGLGGDPRLAPAIQRIVARQDEWGRWPLERGFSNHALADSEMVGQPSKWITLNVLRVLKGTKDE